MKLLNPNEIGTKISTLLIEAEKIFISVSPYLDLSSWKKMLKNLEYSRTKIELIFYYREIKREDEQLLKNIGAKLFHIPNLHAKMYFNENTCIVSSMNLYEYSDLNSIEIATQYINKEEYDVLYSYFEKYIKLKKENSSVSKSYNTVASFSRNREKFVKEVNGHKVYEWEKHKYKDEFVNFEKKLIEVYGYRNCSYANDYMFAKGIINHFDLFIHENENFTLKFTTRVNKIDDIDEWTLFSEKLDLNLKGVDYEFKEGSDSGGYAYHSWEINTANELFKALPQFEKTMNEVFKR